MKLNDIFISKISGEWGAEATLSNAIPVIRTTNFSEYGKIDYSNVVYRDISTHKVDEKHLKIGDIVLEKSGGTDKTPVGRVVYFDGSKTEKYLCNNFTLILRPDQSIVLPRFAFYIMFYLYIKGTPLSYQNKTTGIRNLQTNAYLSQDIEIPSLDMQNKIVKLLDKTLGLISKRKQQLAKLDELAKSRFLEEKIAC